METQFHILSAPNLLVKCRRRAAEMAGAVDTFAVSAEAPANGRQDIAMGCRG
jgi:hypothetical protein